MTSYFYHIYLIFSSYVTGVGKTNHVHTRIEIHFIAYYNSHTQALCRHSDTVAIDKKVYFYRQTFADSIKPHRTNTDPVGHWGALIVWPVVPNCSTWRLLSLWYGQSCCGHLAHYAHQLGRLCLLVLLSHPPSPPPPTCHPLPPAHPLLCGTRDIAGCVQNISQNQIINPVAMYIS